MKLGFFEHLRLFGLAVLFVLPALSSCDHYGKLTPQQHIQKAKDYQTKGALKSSIIELKLALEQDPDNAEARLLLGKIYVEAGDGSSAEDALKRAQKLGVKDESIIVSLGQALLLQKNYDRVLKEIKPAPETSPENLAKVLQIQGDAQLGLGHLEQGCALYKQSVQINVDYVPTYWGLAQCAEAAKNVKEAEKQLEHALKLDTKNIKTWILLGDLARNKNDAKTAEADYTSALKIDPKNADAHLALAQLYLAEDKSNAAQVEVEAARKANPKYLMVNYTQALVYFRQAKYQDARDNLQQVLKAAPNHMPSILLYGAISYELGNYEEAQTNINRFLAQFPGNIYAHKVLAATFLKTRQPAKALETLKPLELGHVTDWQVLAMLGDAHLQAKELSKAAKYFEKAATLNPKNAALRTKIGLIDIVTGDTDHAIAELQSAGELDSSQHKANAFLVMTYLSAKQYDKALQAVKKLQQEQPDNPVWLNLQGAAYLGKKDIANARKSLEKAVSLNPEDIPAAALLAKLDLQENKPGLAKKRFENILQKTPDNEQAMLALADLARQAGQEKEFLSWVNKATKANPSALHPRQILVEYYLKKREPRKALAAAREAQTNNPNSPAALNLLGTAQFAAGEKDNAIASFKKVVELLPKSPEPYLKLGRVQAAAHDTSAAITSLNKALQLKPGYLAAQSTLISVYIGIGKYAEANKIAQDIQTHSSKSPDGYMLEGDILMAQNRYAEAARSYEKAFVVAKSSVLAIKIWQATTQAGDTRDANSALLSWLEEKPNDLGARLILAQGYMNVANNNQAIGQYELILQKDPQNLTALNNLAMLYQHEGDPRAIPTAEKAYRIAPKAALVTDTLGWLLVQNGETGRGIELLRDALSAKPDDLEIGYHYAAGLAKAGDTTNARKQLESLLSSDQEFPDKKQARALLNRL